MSCVVELCLGSKCPKCGERYYSDGYGSIKEGDKVVCKQCGTEFVTNISRNIEGTRETTDEIVCQEQEIIEPQTVIIECLEKLLIATKVLLEKRKYEPKGGEE